MSQISPSTALVPNTSVLSLKMNSDLSLLNKNPGQVLRDDKGRPSFYIYFQKLYKDLEKKIIQESSSTLDASQISVGKDTKELFEVAKKMFLYYNINVEITQECGSSIQTFSVLSIFISIIYSFPREFFSKLRLGTLYFYLNDLEALKRVSGVHEDYILIISNLKSDDEIAKKLHKLIKTSLSKQVIEIPNLEVYGQKSNRGDDLISNQESPLRSCLKSSRRKDSTSSIGSFRDSPRLRKVSFDCLLAEEGKEGSTEKRGRRKSQFRTRVIVKA